MQMTSNTIKRDNVDMNKLITGIGTTMDSFLTDFWDEKLYFISQLRLYLRILQRAFRLSDNNGIKSLIQEAPLWLQIKFENLFADER